jgi:hypothetical protein
MHVSGQELRVGQRDVWRELQLARSHLDARKRSDYPGTSRVLPVLRRRLSD